MKPRRSLVMFWEDRFGGTAHSSGHTLVDTEAALGTLASVVNACIALSSAKLQYVGLNATKEYGTATGESPYPTVKDRAVFLFRCDNNERYRVAIPAPHSAIFPTGTSRVNVEHPLVENLVNACMANLSAQAGGVAITLADAWREQVRTR